MYKVEEEYFVCTSYEQLNIDYYVLILHIVCTFLDFCKCIMYISYHVHTCHGFRTCRFHYKIADCSFYGLKIACTPNM